MSGTPETEGTPRLQHLRCTGCSGELFHDGGVAGLEIPCPHCGQISRFPDDPHRHDDTPRTISDAALLLECRLFGQMPVQAEGTIGEFPIYFRAKWTFWTFTVSLDPEVDPACIDPPAEQNGFFISGYYGTEGFYMGADYPDAGYMRYDVAESLVRDCVRQFLEARKLRKANGD